MASTSPPSGRTRPTRAKTSRRATGPATAPCHPGCGPASRPPPRFSPSWARPLRGGPRLAHDVFAITPIVGTLVILGISTVGLAAVMTWGLPNVQQTQAVAELDGVRNQFFALDQIADGVMRGGAIGKASEGTLSIPKGQLELTNGTLFVVSWYPDHAGRDDRFWFQGIGDDTPQTFSLHAEDIAAADGDYVHVERVYGGTTTTLTADGGGMANDIFSASNNPIAIDLGSRGFEDRATRIRVIESGGTPTEGPVIMESWVLPSGSLHYTRSTSFGLAGFRLENSAVVSEMETGNFLRNQPLGTIELDASENPLFLGLFHMLLVDDPNRPGVEAAGAGSFPILFSLQSNNLRADGLPVEAVHIDAIGPRANLWEGYYDDVMDFTALADADPPRSLHPAFGQTPGPAGVWLEAPVTTVGPPTIRQAFDLALLESIIGVSLQIEIADLGSGV